MAVTLGSLCEKAGYLYGMRVIAGKEGLTNIVQWVHSVEDIEVSDFLHGGELIFSTGIANKGQDWLLPFVKNLIAKNVSGLVLNMSPYIKESVRGYQLLQREKVSSYGYSVENPNC